MMASEAASDDTKIVLNSPTVWICATYDSENIFSWRNLNKMYIQMSAIFPAAISKYATHYVPLFKSTD